MNPLLKIRQVRVRQRLIGLFALGLFASQMTGLVHASDLDAHQDGNPCQICKILERGDGAAPAAATAQLLPEASLTTCADGSIGVLRVTHGVRPPARAPPR